MVLRRWMFGYVALLALLLNACGATLPPPAVTIAAAPLPADWQRTELPSGSIALPPDWAVVTAQDTDLSDAIAEAAAQNPELATLLSRGQTELAGGAVQLIAVDLQAANQDQSAYPANVRLGKQTVPAAPTLSAVSDANEQELRSTAGFSDVQRAPVQLADRPATRLVSKLSINNAIGDPLVLAVEQYLLVNATDVYIITFTAAETSAARYRATYDQILATLKLDS